MKNKEEADKRTAKENEFLQDAHWVAPGLENRGGISLEDQIIFSRKTGRRSFGNFNPQIEKLYKEKNQEEKLTSSSSITKDIELEKGTITEEEMLERYQTYIHSSTNKRNVFYEQQQEKKRKIEIHSLSNNHN